MNEKIEVENINVPGYISRVDRVKYEKMREILLEILPTEAPGITAAEMLAKMKPILPQDLWPNGEKCGWWQKTVQLDLEAKGLMQRDAKAKPLRWWRLA